MSADAEGVHQLSDAFHQLGEVLGVGHPGLIVAEARVELVHHGAVGLQVLAARVRDRVNLAAVLLLQPRVFELLEQLQGGVDDARTRAVGAAGALLSLVAMGWSWKLGLRAAALAAAAGVVAGALAFGVPSMALQEARRVPPIHDISTDIANPPAFVALLAARLAAPNGADYAGEALAEQQRKGYPDIAPLALAAPPAAAFERALAAARALGWTIVAAEPNALRIEATDMTPFFGFKDDVVIRITPSGEASRVDVRSMSRVGRSDLGANARRIRAFTREVAK